jgi:DNA-binding NarL/FixJ family response regulator
MAHKRRLPIEWKLIARRLRRVSRRVAIVDIRMPPTHTGEGLQAAKLIRAHWPETGILVLSQFVQARCAMEGLEG